ncbi:MAG: LytTR family DNA-binding domain-containing protein [Bacteroidales bacterium]|nr:LytTR family DNA-binding domain-containing protein [Bacteroidales bacterium]
MRLKCVIVDDEPLAISVIEQYIAQTSFLEMIAGYTNAVRAFEYLSENETDLLFIDIQMPDMSGLELIRGLKNPPALIFTTAFDQYALEGFRVDAIDYLLKPIDYPEFLRAVTKARDLIALLKGKAANIKTSKDFLFIKSEYKIIRIEFNDIRYIQGMSEYVKIILTHGKPVMSLLSLKSLESQLPTEKFMRVHKSYIVNLQKITVIERMEIVNDDGTIIPVSPQYKARFQEYLDNNFLL